MCRFIALAALVLTALSIPTFAEDRKEPAPRSLADDAALLTEKSGKGFPDAYGWRSGAVTLTTRREGGETKAKGRLMMQISVPRGKVSGSVALVADLGHVKSASDSRPDGKPTFELSEKDGKRFMTLPGGMLEYTLRGDELTVQGGKISGWAGWDVDLTQPTSFKPFTEVDDLRQKVKTMTARIEELERTMSEPELKKLQGTWKVRSMEGDKVPPPDQLEKMRVVIAGDKITMKIGGRDDHTIRVFVDPTKKPCTIDFGPGGDPDTTGIYELDKDTLRICLGKGSERPKELSGRKPEQVLMILQREPK
jgi:uncharacterized protein (TIGR03067 family)